MKHVYLAYALLFFIQSNAFSQKKNDYNWVLGYIPNDGSIITFTKDTFSIKKFPKKNGIDGMSGKLLYFSNGCSIQNSKDETIIGGNDLQKGSALYSYCDYGPPPSQTNVFLPFPNSDLLYYIYGTIDNKLQGDKLHLAQISVSKDKVVTNKIILKDTLYGEDNVLVTKHSNGKDWWILSCDYNYKNYYSLLLTENGIEKTIKMPYYQKTLDYPKFEYAGQTAFSPNGLFHARIGFLSDLHLFNFDRCTGLLSNEKVIKIDIKLAGEKPMGVSFSPNNRFMYASSASLMYQFDLEAKDIVASKILVDTLESFFDAPLRVNFYNHSITPDNRIIVGSSTGVSYMHTINKPNELGKACELKQHNIKLPAFNAGILNFPNYRLEASGQICTTATEDVSDIPLKIYPNPAQDILHLESESGEAIKRVVVYNAIGEQVYVSDYQGIDTLEINTSTFQNGMYVMRISYGDNRAAQRKIVVLH
jgi:hypothetical protein